MKTGTRVTKDISDYHILPLNGDSQMIEVAL